MTITNQQDVLLNQIKEKAFISSILAEQSYNYFCFVKNVINIPLIVCNSAMVCINSVIEDQNTLKILNIILNSSTGLILSLISNFKIYEQINQFHQLNIKFNKLSNMIYSKLSNDYDNNEDNNHYVLNIINTCDNNNYINRPQTLIQG
jgi:hypothetical protein